MELGEVVMGEEAGGGGSSLGGGVVGVALCAASVSQCGVFEWSSRRRTHSAAT